MVDHVLDAGRSTRAEAIEAAPGARARRAAADGDGRVPRTAAATTPTSASTATCSPPAEAVIGRTRVDGAVALKLTLLNPQTTPRRHRRAARRDRQRGSLTGSLTVRDSPAALRTRAGDPDGLERARAAWSAAAAAARARCRRRASACTCGPLSVRLATSQPRRQPHVERAVLVAREPAPASCACGPAAASRARSGTARAATTRRRRRRRRRRHGRGTTKIVTRHELGLADAVADPVGDARPGPMKPAAGV